MSATEVVRYMKEFRLIAKPLVTMAGGAVLELKLQGHRTGVLVFRRGNEIPELGQQEKTLFNVWDIRRSLPNHRVAA